MYLRPILAGLLAVPLFIAADAATPPPGWKEYSPKDRSFSVWLPEKSGRRSGGERTVTIRGLRIKINLVQVEARGGMTYEASTLLLAGRGVTSIPTKAKLEIIRDVFLNEVKGTVASETDITNDQVPGKEYTIQTGSGVARLRAFARGGRLYRASVIGSKTQVASKDADTFLESYQLSAKAPDAAADASTDKGKEKAVSSGKTDASGLKWLADAAKMVASDAPVCGKLLGSDFQPDKVEFNSFVGVLALEQGRDADIKIFLFLKQGERLDDRSYKINARGRIGEQRPHIHIGSKSGGRNSYTGEYAMRLEFGKEKDGMIPGKIYLCLPDENKSVVAGTFTAKRK